MTATNGTSHSEAQNYELRYVQSRAEDRQT